MSLELAQDCFIKPLVLHNINGMFTACLINYQTFENVSQAKTQTSSFDVDDRHGCGTAEQDTVLILHSTRQVNHNE